MSPGPVIPVLEVQCPPLQNGDNHTFFVRLLLDDELFCACVYVGHEKCSVNRLIVIVEGSEGIDDLVGDFRKLLPKNVLQLLGAWSWWQVASFHTVRVGMARSRGDYVCHTFSCRFFYS